MKNATMTHIHDKILPKGSRIGVYEIKDPLKIGAFDITYHAWNHHLKERVHLQEYFPHDCATRASDGLNVEAKSIDNRKKFEYGLQVFQNQAEALTQISHPNIEIVENILQHNGTAYQIISHQAGVPLSKLVESPAALAESELYFILVAILDALQAVHEAKIIHGGIQPETIYLDKNGEPLLTHFASARLVMAAYCTKLEEELVSGYSSAEQYEQTNASGPATDFYALGATIYYCMTRHRPIDARSRIAILDKGESDPMILLSGSENTEYSPEWVQVVNWMLRPDYHARPQSVAEIMRELKKGVAHDPDKISTSEQKAAMNAANENSIVSNPMGTVTMIGITAFLVTGLWTGEQASETLNGKLPDFLAARSSTEEYRIDETVATLGSVENQFTVTTNTQSNRPDRRSIVDEELIQAHLNAAEKAMQDMRFTTPQADNANKYYQMVLTIDPGNIEALAGLQKIVDLYVQLIAKAKTAGRFDEARLYLRRAESVLPNDPGLRHARSELEASQRDD